VLLNQLFPEWLISLLLFLLMVLLCAQSLTKVRVNHVPTSCQPVPARLINILT
jgi:hypothetical protein